MCFLAQYVWQYLLEWLMSQFVPLFHSCRGARDFSLSNRGQFSLLMPTLRNKDVSFSFAYYGCLNTGSPSSKYKHRRTSTLLHNIRNTLYKDLYGKKPIVFVTYENERISIKNSLPCIKCVLRHSSVVHGPIYGRFMGCTVNCFLSI